MPQPHPMPLMPQRDLAALEEARPAHDPKRRRACLHLGALALAGLSAPQAVRADDKDFWRLLREGGCVLLMRHAATEPGLGDPPGMRLDDCRTQRNLSAAGRAQAARVGEAFRREGVALADVRSSAWCRCVDTATTAFGRHRVWVPLNSFFQGGDGDAQTREVRRALAGLRAPANWMFVTHQVNITALTGSHPAMGEIFIARPATDAAAPLNVLARLIVA